MKIKYNENGLIQFKKFSVYGDLIDNGIIQMEKDDRGYYIINTDILYKREKEYKEQLEFERKASSLFDEEELE